MTTINLLFAPDLGLVTALLEGERLELGDLEAEDDAEGRDRVADDAVISLFTKVFTCDNVCASDDDEDVSPLSLSPVSVTWKNKLLEAV